MFLFTNTHYHPEEQVDYETSLAGFSVSIIGCKFENCSVIFQDRLLGPFV